MYDDHDYKKAEKRVKDKKKFYAHLSTSAVIIGVCFIINMMTSPYVNWYKWVVLGMGIPLAIHFFNAFGIPGLYTPDASWEEKEIEKELRKQRGKRNYLPPPDPEDGLELKELSPEKRKTYDDQDLV